MEMQRRYNLDASFLKNIACIGFESEEMLNEFIV